MYEIEIVTKYNTIKLIVEDYNTPQVQEILNQPYILSVNIKKIKSNAKVRRKSNEKRN